MRDLPRRVKKLEREGAARCPACPPVVLVVHQPDGTIYNNQPTDPCPICGREPEVIRVQEVVVDPADGHHAPGAPYRRKRDEDCDA